MKMDFDKICIKTHRHPKQNKTVGRYCFIFVLGMEDVPVNSGLLCLCLMFAFDEVL